MTGVSFKRVLEAVQKGIFDQLIEGVPDEFLTQIKAWKGEIDTESSRIAISVNGSLLAVPRSWGQKDFALWVQSVFAGDKNMQSYLFAARAGKDYLPLIYKKAFENRPNSDEVQVIDES